MVELFANNRDPDQTPRTAASDLGLHCLLVTRLGVSSLQWVKSYYGACGFAKMNITVITLMNYYFCHVSQ